MPGIPQGRHINEAGPKSVTMVTIGDNGTISIEERQTGLVQFERVSIDATAITDWSNLLLQAENELTSLRKNVQASTIIVRVEFNGETCLAAQLRRDQDLMLEELRSLGQRIGSVIIESVECDVDEPVLETKSIAGDPIGELRQIIQTNDQARQMAALDLRDSLALLQQKLPPELRDKFGTDDAMIDALLDGYIDEGSKDVLARLQASTSHEESKI